MNDSTDQEIPTPPKAPTPAEFAEALKQHAIAAALQQPHQLYLADTVLKIAVDGGSTTLTLGATNVAGALSPLFSCVLSTRFALELSSALRESVEKAAPKIREDAKFIEEFLPRK